MKKQQIKYLRPASSSAEDLFLYCVRKIIDMNFFSEEKTHLQWACSLFSYEKNSTMRVDYMSKVKCEYSCYMRNNGSKYAFIKEKIVRDFPFLFGINDANESEEATCDDIIQENIIALSKEISEQKNPNNIEKFKGSDLTLIKKQGKSYIYHVKLILTEGQEPHFHEGIPFYLKVFDKNILCEAVDFDYESGQLFFTSATSIKPASFCSVLLDSSFILEGLKQRLKNITEEGVNDKLPFTKFFFDETQDLKDIKHKVIPQNIKKSLDESQKKAFDAALNKDITFIWGPPGTGKSYTLASIIYALYELGEDKTVVCCLSNVAVDQLLCKVLDIIDKNGEKIEAGNIYRAGGTMDGRINATDYLFPNNDFTDNLRSRIKRNLERIKVLKERNKDLSEEAISIKAENKELRENLREHTEFLIKSSRIVFSTISNFILSKTLFENSFDNLIVDEASMLSMPSLIALGSKISKRIIMVGDFQQLSPIAIVKDYRLTESVFEMTGINIKETSHPGLHQLLNQRRSNEKIVDIINNTFYKGKLIPQIKGISEIINSEPYKGKVIALRNVPNGAVRFTKGGTRQNKTFAISVIDLLDSFYADKKAKYSIGVITPYKGQVSLLRALKIERNYPEEFDKRVKIGTIHTFQGSECDVIIYDMVDCAILESGKPSRIGKIYSGEAGERLINVAVSRAKHKLIVVCDSKYIRNIPGNTITDSTRRVFQKLSQYTLS